MWHWNLMDGLEKQQGTLSILLQTLCNISQPLVNSDWSYSPETHNLGQNWRFFVRCHLEIRRVNLKNNRVPLPIYFKPCATFYGRLWIQTGVTVRKPKIWVKIGDFLSPATLKLDGWPWKTIWYPFKATSSYESHLVALCEFKLKLWTGKAPIGAKFALTSVTLTFDLWP